MRRPRAAAALLAVSAALLAYELLLMRLLSMAWSGQFAGFTISVAMLGLAGAGIALHLARERVRRAPERAMAVAAGLFAVTGPLAFLLSQRVPFTPYLLLLSAREFAVLALHILLYALPFFAAGIAVGAPFVAAPQRAARLYACNMGGSALAALPLVAAMSQLHPMLLLPAVAALALLGAWFAGLGARGLGAGAVVVVLAATQPLRYSEYKDLPRTLQLPGAALHTEIPGPDAVVQLVESPRTRWLPGLSLDFRGELPPATTLFSDGESLDLLYDPALSRRDPGFLQAMPEALGWRLRPGARALLLEVPAAEILRALLAAGEPVVLVENSPARLQALAGWLGPAGRASGMSLQRDAPRHYLATQPGDWQLVELSLLGSSQGGSMLPLHLLTREGFDALWQSLAADGILAVSVWVENPPRSGTRLAAWLVDGLQRNGVAKPEAQVIALRGWSTLHVLLGRHSFTAGEVREARRFAASLSFDLVHAPQMQAGEANRFNEIPGAPYFSAFRALFAGDAAAAAAGATWQLGVPSDDRPFFGHWFRWGSLPALLSLHGDDWLPYVDVAYLLQCVALVAAALLGLALLLPPCIAVAAAPGARTLVLFFCLGAGYMAVEIWAIDHLSLYLSGSFRAATLCLSVLLPASGAGALLLAGRAGPAGWPLAGLLLALLVLLGSGEILLRLGYGAPLGQRLVLATLWLLPAGLMMGYPFPAALARLSPGAVPWALAVNGFGAVLGGLAAGLVALDLGLRVLGGAALALYAVAALALRAGGTSGVGTGGMSGAEGLVAGGEEQVHHGHHE